MDPNEVRIGLRVTTGERVGVVRDVLRDHVHPNRSVVFVQFEGDHALMRAAQLKKDDK